MEGMQRVCGGLWWGHVANQKHLRMHRGALRAHRGHAEGAQRACRGHME